MILFLFLLALDFLLGFLLVTRDNQNWFIYVVSLFGILFACLSIFSLSYFFFYQRTYRHIENVMDDNTYHFYGQVKEISDKTITISSEIKAYEVLIEGDKEKKIAYLWENFDLNQIKKNNFYSFEISDHFIQRISKNEP